MRAAMGIGAAAVMPVTLSIITTSFPPQERGRAVGIWVGVAGGGAVLGLFGSGLLLEFFAWNSFFTLNVVLAVLAFIGTLAVIPGSRDHDAAGLDPVGGLLSLVGVAALVFGIIEGPERGWTEPLTAGALIVAALALTSFVLWGLRRDDPLLDPRLFRLRGFSTGSLALVAQFFASFGLFFVILQYLQYIVGQSPLQSAVSLLPLPLVLIPLARNAPRIAARFGPNRVIALGLTLSAVGMILLTGLSVELDYWYLALGLGVFAAGMGLAGTPATTAITASLPRAKQGVGSAVNDTSRELGSALGIAVLGSALTAGYRTGLGDLTGVPPQVAAQAQASIAFIRAGADRIGPDLVTTAQQAFVDATGTAFTAAAATLLVVATIVLFRGPGRDTPDTPDDAELSTAGQPVGRG